MRPDASGQAVLFGQSAPLRQHGDAGGRRDESQAHRRQRTVHPQRDRGDDGLHGRLEALGHFGHGPATVLGVDGNVVTVQYKDGTKQQVVVTTSTQITKVVRGSLSDLKPGETVDVSTAVPVTGATASPAAGATPAASAVPATQITIHAPGASTP